MSKIALLMGLNYVGSESELGGCINDIENVSEMLTTVYKYKKENVVARVQSKSYKRRAAKNRK